MTDLSSQGNPGTPSPVPRFAEAVTPGPTPEPERVQRLTGVYDAEGSVLGELRYFLRARLGGAHCALCDITHGRVREKPSWRRCRAELPVPFDAVHLDERAPELVTLTDGKTPCIVAHATSGDQILLGPDELEACRGSPERLVAVITQTAHARGLELAP